MKEPRFGKVQLQIMRVLWDRERATARDITDALNKTDRIAHSTVQTLLRKLEEKGAVTHEISERTFVFRPLVKPERFVRKATRDFVDRVFSGSASGLLSYILKNEHIPAGELNELRALIDEHARDSSTRRKRSKP